LATVRYLSRNREQAWGDFLARCRDASTRPGPCLIHSSDCLLRRPMTCRSKRFARSSFLAGGVALAMLAFDARQVRAATDAFKTTTSGAAWLTTGNWSLGAIPTSSDVALLTN